MSNAEYIKEFLDVMYVEEFLDYKLEVIKGTTTHSHIYNDGDDEIVLAITVEDGEESFVVTGSQIGADHSYDSEVEIVATNNPIVALNKFEEAIEAITSRI
jgi:hypothetical protein